MMKCPACNTHVHKIPVNWKCTQCGEKLPDPSKWYLFWEGFGESLDDKGTVFWSIILGIILILIGLPELIIGDGLLLGYLTNSMVLAIAGIFFGGMLLEMYFKMVLPLRLPYGSDFLVKERAVIRNFRKGTHLAAIAAIMTCIIWLGPKMFLRFFPAYFMVLGWFLALSWAIGGLFLDARMVEDVRFRFFMERIGIVNLKTYRKVGALTIILLVVIIIGYYILMNIPGLWQSVNNTAFIGGTIHIFSEYLSWLF